ncbi:MAG: hypothetical protein FWC71_09680 [Defluviitaleaceae bacterium]|nr:hypothetical protein [Defluviitaleaceae bacterium]
MYETPLMHETQNKGNIVAEFKTKASMPILIKTGAVILAILLIFAGIFFINDPQDPGDRIGGFAALGVTPIVLIGLFWLANSMKSKVTVYEEGVHVIKGRNNQSFHFNQIAGLTDNPDDVSFSTVAGGGVLGAVVAGAIAGAAAAVRDAHYRRTQPRTMIIKPNTPELKDANVIKTAGGLLSERFTNWYIKQHNITPATVPNMTLSFGDELRLENGVFIQTRRKGDIHLPVVDITNLQANEDGVNFYAYNEKGKEKCKIVVGLSSMYNLDLLFDVVDMFNAEETPAEAHAEASTF